MAKLMIGIVSLGLFAAVAPVAVGYAWATGRYERAAEWVEWMGARWQQAGR